MKVSLSSEVVLPAKGDAEIEAAIRELYGPTTVANVFPLGQERLKLTIVGADVVFASAICRVLTDEMLGMRLDFKMEDFSSNDPFMKAEIVRMFVRQIPLRASLREAEHDGLRLNLDVVNTQTSTAMLEIAAGDIRAVSEGAIKLTGPLFNPTTIITSLQPGSTMSIKNIKVVTDQVALNSTFGNVCMTACVPLDVVEEDADLVRRTSDGIGRRSGYTVPTMLANPRSHLVTGEINAVLPGEPIARTKIVLACQSLQVRLRAVQALLQQGQTDQKDRHMQIGTSYWFTTTSGGISRLEMFIKAETDTIGELLKVGIMTEGKKIANIVCPTNRTTGHLHVNFEQHIPESDIQTTVFKAIQWCVKHLNDISLQLKK